VSQDGCAHCEMAETIEENIGVFDGEVSQGDGMCQQ
jgi:hypothetical protein